MIAYTKGKTGGQGFALQWIFQSGKGYTMGIAAHTEHRQDTFGFGRKRQTAVFDDRGNGV